MKNYAVRLEMMLGLTMVTSNVSIYKFDGYKEALNCYLKKTRENVRAVDMSSVESWIKVSLVDINTLDVWHETTLRNDAIKGKKVTADFIEDRWCIHKEGVVL